MGRGEQGERLILTHPVQDASGALVGIMLIVRNLEYLSQVQSTLRYSRKLAALGRLSAGVAHEVKNPLNAMMIHLELLRQQFQPSAAHAPGRGARAAGGCGRRTGAPDVGTADALSHVDVIAAEIRRLDEVVQGFIKFTRPEDLKLQSVSLGDLFGEVVPILQPEADRAGVQVRRGVRRRAAGQRRSGDAAPGLPESRTQRLSGDAGRRHAAHRVRGGARPPRARDRSRTPASASSPNT